MRGLIKSPVYKLQQQMKEVEKEIARYQAQLREKVDPDVEEADPGLTAHSVTIALLSNARQKAEAIKRALKQARAGGYGTCEACRQPINPERLEIFPQATLCVPCKSMRESKFSFRAA